MPRICVSQRKKEEKKTEERKKGIYKIDHMYICNRKKS